MSQEQKKPIESSTSGHQSNWKPILMGVAGIASVLLLLQILGVFNTFDKTRSTSAIDMNGSDYQNRPMQARRAEQPNAQTEATLQEIADEFQGPVFEDIHTANSQKGWGLSDDQAKYYDDMRKLYGKNSPNWLSMVRQANDTYRTVQSIFGGTSDVSLILQDANRTQQIFQQLKDLFGLSIQTSQTLQKNGANKVSDWARYIESMKKR